MMRRNQIRSRAYIWPTLGWQRCESFCALPQIQHENSFHGTNMRWQRFTSPRPGRCWGRGYTKRRRVGRDESGNRDNAASSGSRCSNSNNVAWNSNWNIAVRAAGDDWFSSGLPAKARDPDHKACQWSARSTCFGENITRFGERRVGFCRKPCRHFFMGMKHKNLFGKIVSTDNLYVAYHKAARGKRYTMGHMVFREHLATNIGKLASTIMDGSYQPGTPKTFMVFEPKPREISALPFVDRVAQHALCNVLEPIFDNIFLPQSYACRTGRGTHQAAIEVQSTLRRMRRLGGNPWVLKTDFSRYFASIDRALLHTEFRRKIACRRTLDMLERFIPPHGRGLPIGNLTSQLGANLYGHIFDRWLVHQVGVTRFARYMDDVVVMGYSREAMALLQVQAEAFALHTMGLRFSRWSIQSWRRGVNFCGYRIWPGHKLLRKSSITRARRKLKRFRKNGDTPARNRFLASWRGHARWADSHNLINSLGAH